MKGYLVFTYSSYYPCGGWNDYVGVYETLDDAISAGKKEKEDYVQVVDADTLEVVYWD